MNIVDHLSLGVPSISEACNFYDGLMKTLGVDLLAETSNFAAYGKDAVQFLLMTPLNEQSCSAGNGTHIAFKALSQSAVDAFHAYAMENGGVCEGSPGQRPAYPKPNVYTAFVRDPFGNKLEAIFNGFAT